MLVLSRMWRNLVESASSFEILAPSSTRRAARRNVGDNGTRKSMEEPSKRVSRSRWTRQNRRRRISCWRTHDRFASLIETVSFNNAPARSRGTRHVRDSLSFFLYLSLSLFTRSFSGSAGRSAGTPEIMLGRTARAQGRGTATERRKGGRKADRDIQKERKMRKENGTRNARIERVT